MPTSTQLVLAPTLLSAESSSASANDAGNHLQDPRLGATKLWDRHPAAVCAPSPQRHQLLPYSRLPLAGQSRIPANRPQEKLNGWGTMPGLVPDGIRVPVATADDIVLARQQGRNLALRLGFSPIESTLVATAISELARNIVSYAKSGAIQLEPAHDGDRKGVAIVARDEGPGIEDIQRALLGGYSTSEGLGLGLSGVRRIMDELSVDSGAGKGTTVTARKWRDLRR